jgi:L-ascorbate metabolism protein UlaG (beta-lactamase superfamily)
MKPAVHNIRPQRRADFVLQLVLKDSTGTPITLTGWQVLAQVWDKGRTTKYGDFTVTVTDASAGAVTLTLPYTVTATLPTECRYDVMVINGDGLREYYLEGIVRPSEGYTAPA